MAARGILSLSRRFLNASKVPEMGDYRVAFKPGALNKANADRFGANVPHIIQQIKASGAAHHAPLPRRAANPSSNGAGHPIDALVSLIEVIAGCVVVAC